MRRQLRGSSPLPGRRSHPRARPLGRHVTPEHVEWYHGIGANCIQTFAVSCNGFAWYKNGVVPAQPGLKYAFLPQVVRLGHKKGMQVMAYFCAGANTKFAQDHPELSYGTPGTLHIPFTDEYLAYLSRSIADAVRKTKIDGFMIGAGTPTLLCVRRAGSRPNVSSSSRSPVSPSLPPDRAPRTSWQVRRPQNPHGAVPGGLGPARRRGLPGPAAAGSGIPG